MKMRVVSGFMLCLLFFPGALVTAKANELGVGLVTPVPTGITVKLWLDNINAFDIVGAWNLHDQKYYVHADYLTHDFSKFSVEPGTMAFYYGFGGRIKEVDDPNSDAKVGIRIPFGLAYYPQSAPFEIFGELAPRLDVVPHTAFGLNVMLGIRYRINPG